MISTIKNYLPQTLLARSTLIVLLPVLILQIVTVYIFFDRHWSKTIGRLSDAVAGEIAVMADMIEFNDDPNLALVQVLNYTKINLDMTARLIPNGLVELSPASVSFLKRPAIHYLDSALVRRVHRPFAVMPYESDKFYDIQVQLKNAILSVQVPERRLYSSSSYVFLIWMIGISLSSTLVSMIFLRNQIRPIRKLAIAAERFGRGQDVENFKPQGAREVRAAGRSFMNMRDRIRRQVEQRTVMLAGVSHDMRTPLTRIKLALSLLPEDDDVRALKGDVNTMEAMLNAYLDFVKGEGGERAETVDLSQIVRNVLSRFHTKKLDLSYNGPDLLYAAVRPVAFTRAVTNIVSNACRYGSVVVVRVTQDAGQIVVGVEDNGPGIHPDQYEDAFKPFTRLDASRHLDSAAHAVGTAGGPVGLGLAIARDLVHAHGGEIVLGRSEALGGLKVEMFLPK